VAKTLGRWGEDLVARLLNYVRVPLSGAKWPYVEDLFRERDGIETFMKRSLAQVKTTQSQKFVERWALLEKRAEAEDAEPRWYEVYVGSQEVLIFEKRLVRRLNVGIGGEVGAP